MPEPTAESNPSVPQSPDPGARRFAIVAPNFYPRTCGVGDYSVRLAGELIRRGHEASVFSRAPAEPHPASPGLAFTGAPGARPLDVARALWPSLRDAHPTDVLIQYTAQMWDASRLGSPGVPWLAARAKRAGARVTLVAHELFTEFAGRPDRWVSAALLRAQLAAILASCEHAFVTADARVKHLAPYCRALGLPPPGVLRIGPNALPVRASPVPGRARLGLFSTAAVGKRFDVVLKAFTEVTRVFPQAELVLLGDLGAPTLPRVREILAAVAAHPSSARIRITGKLPLADIAREIATLDLYLFPMNTGANTRSGTLPVALGAGLPVVAIDGAETDHPLFRDGENVLFAPALEGTAFGRTALRALGDPNLAARVGAGARALFEQHLDWPGITDHLLETIAPGARR
jgi:glycosyltransferase involved in cell wall biosynthesis